MANILADIGRANIQEPVKRVSDMVMEARRMRNQEQEASEISALRGQQMELTSEQIKAARFEREQKERVDAEMKKFIPLSSLGLENNPIGQDLYNLAGSIGVIDREENTGVEGINGYGLQRLQQTISARKDVDKQLTTKLFMHTQGQIAQIQKALANPKLKPEEKQQLEMQRQQVIETSAFLKESLNALDDALRREEYKAGLEKEKAIAVEKEKGSQRIAAIKEMNSGRARLTKLVQSGGGKIGATKEMIVNKIATGGMKSLTAGEKEAFAVITKNDPDTRRGVALKAALKELSNDPKYKMAKTKEQRNQILGERVEAIETLLESIAESSDITQEDIASLEHPVSGYKDDYSTMSDDELLKILGE